MGSVGIGGIGGKSTTSAAKKIQDQFRRETQKDDDRRGLGASPKVTPTPQKSFLESLYDRVRGSITFAGGDPNRKKRPDPNPGALYTASPFIIPAATAVTASVLGPGVDYTDPTQVPTGTPSIYTPASRDFGKGTEPMATPEKPETAKFDVTDLLGLKEKVARGDAPGLMAPPSMDQPAAPATARSAAMTAGINKVLKDVIAPKSKEYKIKGGDTLSAISRREGVSVDDLVKINGIEDKDKIYAGDSIIIPKPEEVEQAKEFVLRVSTRGDEDPDAQFYSSFTQGITPKSMTQQTGAGKYESPDDMTDLEILARTIEAEAGGESKKGKLAVGAVILNRASQNRYGNDIKSVILKPAQFSPWNSYTGYAGGEQGKEMLTEKTKPSKAAYEIAEKLLSGDYEDPTRGATHFVNPKISKPNWYDDFKSHGTTKIGKHEFGDADKMLLSPRPKARPLGRP
jgi:spore germination cell wall hydrolase CwlJ-like protein